DRDVFCEHSLVFGRTASQWINAKLDKLLFKLGIFDRSSDFIGDLVDDLGWRSGWRHQAIPRKHLEVGIARLRDSWDLRRKGRACFAGNGEHTNGAALRLRQCIRKI